MSAIYKTHGRAKEYCDLAINLYTGCAHQCIYCYGADVTHQSQEEFKNPRPRNRILQHIEADAKYWAKKGEKGPVLMCFVTDPYQPIEEEHQITRRAIEILHRNGLRVTILTKAGKLAQRDFDLLRPTDAFATTLTLLGGVDDTPIIGKEDTRYWEPNAALPADRIENLLRAHLLGIETWVSCEPVIYPKHTLELIKLTHDFVDIFKVGTMNYQEHGKTINWRQFVTDVIALLEKLGARYYIKKDLAVYLGKHEAIKRGV